MWATDQIKSKWRIRLAGGVLAIAALGMSLFGSVPVEAINPLPIPDPGVGSYGIEATKPQPPPTDPATIVTPTNGSSFTESPITASGFCTTGLLVQIYDNGALVGAIDCVGGSFSIDISLFTGLNDITAIQFDDLGQASPVSNTVTVSYNNASFSAFGALITLTSNYGRRAANPGQTLTWPLLLSGGTGPYAFSINWGDGTEADLMSVALAGGVDIKHVYDRAGIYHVTVKVTDVNGVSAFLQLVAIANGTPADTNNSAIKAKTVTVVKWVWWPALAALVLLPTTYWLGRRSQLVSLHRKLEKDIENYKEL